MCVSRINKDGVGFEPTEPFSSFVFKTNALAHYANHPCLFIMILAKHLNLEKLQAFLQFPLTSHHETIRSC